MDAETLQALVELADKITTFGLFLAWVSWLIRENAQLKELVYTDWKRQREEEIEARAEEKFQKKLSTIPNTGSGIQLLYTGVYIPYFQRTIA